MSIWAGIKYAINSTLGTSDFKPLNTLIQEHANWNMNQMMARLIGKDTWSGHALDVRIARMVYQPFIEENTPGWHGLKIPYGVVSISIDACAGGGGGGSGDSSSGGGGGGGGGGEWVEGYTWNISPSLWDSMVYFHVGAGGAGAAEAQNGENGYPTIIGGVITLNGGEGGGLGAITGGAAGGASAGAGGGYGTNGNDSAKAKGGARGCSANYCGGGGGASWGDGGRGQSNNSANNKTAPGFGGGGGGGSSNNYTRTGAKGGDGFCNFYFNW